MKQFHRPDGLKTKQTPSQVKEMSEFEKELINLNFGKDKDAFQNKLKKT